MGVTGEDWRGRVPHLYTRAAQPLDDESTTCGRIGKSSSMFSYALYVMAQRVFRFHMRPSKRASLDRTHNVADVANCKLLPRLLPRANLL